MTALAVAVTEEARSSDLAARTRDLLYEYSRRSANYSGEPTGASLRDNAGFVGRLQDVASHAEQARKDATDQAQWHSQSLAAAEIRSARFEERMVAARREMAAIQESRDQTESTAMARKLHSKSKAAGGM